MGQRHGHGIAPASQARRGRLVAVLAVTATVLVVEVIGAILSDSLALLAENTDSGQVLDQLSACVAGHFDVEHEPHP